MKNKKSEIPEGWHMQITVKAVVLNKEGKVLLLKRADDEATSSHKYDLPGGNIEKGENFQSSLIREIREETGLTDIKVGSIIKASEFPEGHEKLDELKALRFMVYCNSGEVKLNSREHSEYKWVDIDEAINMLDTGDGFEEEKKETLKIAKEYLELQKSMDGWKRCMADFENYKKRQAEAQKDLIKYSTESIVYQILPVLDNFHSSTDHIPEDQKENSWVTGIMYIQKQLKDVLKDNGVEEIEVEEGDEFDPAIHEAIDHETQNMEHGTREFESTNKIVKVLSKGYKLGDKVIRAARVVVK